MVRTTLTLDDDLAPLLRRLQEERGLSFKEAVNLALRAGLSGLEEPRRKAKPYRLKAVSLGRCLLPTLDSVAEVLDLAEGEDRL